MQLLGNGLRSLPEPKLQMISYEMKLMPSGDGF